MWTLENRPKYNRDHLRYPSDLTDDEWGRYVAPLISAAQARLVASGGPTWRAVMKRGDVYPEHRFANGATFQKGLSAVQHGPPLLHLVAMRWCAESHSSRTLRRMPRKGGTRKPAPTAAINTYSQSVKSAEKRGACIDPHGYDAGKKDQGARSAIYW